MKKMNLKWARARGFTLIELLVVIAIIGILSSVVLVSLNSARKKGTDARVISDVQQTRTALESGYNGSGYPDLNGGATNCATTGSLALLNACEAATAPDAVALNQVAQDAATEGGNVYIIASSTNAGYAIMGQLTSNSAAYFCIDSTGKTNQSDNGAKKFSSTCNP